MPPQTSEVLLMRKAMRMRRQDRRRDACENKGHKGKDADTQQNLTLGQGASIYFFLRPYV